MLGIDALLEILAASKVPFIFGNPGSTELPLNDALARDARIRYILGLQEVPVTAMADGYAIASGKLGVACLHASCGLGNAMGMIYNAHVAGTPLLILAGQQDRRLRLGEPVLDGDTVSVARPWTKVAMEVQRVEDLPAALRRAIQAALTPPTGPVFLSVPVDVQLDSAEGLDLRPPNPPDRRVRPAAAALRKAAEILSLAKGPAILAGSRVTESDGVAELVALAELLGAPVYAEQQTSHGRLPMPSDHPLYGGCLPLWSPAVRQQLDGHDVILAVGMNLLRLYLYQEPSNPIPEHIRVIHLDADPWEIGKNHAVEVGLLGDPKAGLAELARLVSDQRTSAQVEAAARRLEEGAARRAAERRALLAEIDAQREQRPMTPHAFMGALARALPGDAAMIEEAATTHGFALERLGVFRDPSGRIAHRGWALGWGVGCAVGAKLAWPDRTVMALLGDGAALYGIQGLWTAAHHGVPVTFVIANNAQYQILKRTTGDMGLSRLAASNYPALDLVQPEVDLVGLSRALGVEAHRVTEPDELSQWMVEAPQRSVPILLDVPIQR